ncbi:MAG: hypothetical protein ABIS67_04835 [Candidatus Eisenbacteria bacterium]
MPAQVFLVGCQPEGFDESGAELSVAVQDAVVVAVSRIESLIESLRQGGGA